MHNGARRISSCLLGRGCARYCLCAVLARTRQNRRICSRVSWLVTIVIVFLLSRPRLRLRFLAYPVNLMRSLLDHLSRPINVCSIQLFSIQFNSIILFNVFSPQSDFRQHKCVYSLVRVYVTCKKKITLFVMYFIQCKKTQLKCSWMLLFFCVSGNTGTPPTDNWWGGLSGV